MSIYFNWARERTCQTCHQKFTSMNGLAKECVICRNTPEAADRRKARRRKQNTEWQRRDRRRKARA